MQWWFESILAHQLTMDKNWKRFERRVALKTGGERIPVSDRRTPLDVKHPYLGIECKYRRKLSKFLTDAMAQAEAGSGEDLIPTVVLGEYNSPRMYALVNIEDLLKLLVAALGETNPPILVGAGEDDYEYDG
jgi:hypothetical protein